MNNLQRLHRIVECHQREQLRFGKRRTLVDATTASLLVKLYRALGEEGKAKFARMVETSSGFARTVDFAWSKVKGS